MAIVISIHQVADKSVTWKQAAQATQFGAIWLQLIGQEVWQKLSYLFDQLPRLHKSLGNPTDLVCSRNDYILWYKFQKFKKCKNISGYALSYQTSQMFCSTTQCNQNKIFEKPSYEASNVAFKWLKILGFSHYWPWKYKCMSQHYAKAFILGIINYSLTVFFDTLKKLLLRPLWLC